MTHHLKLRMSVVACASLVIAASAPLAACAGAGESAVVKPKPASVMTPTPRKPGGSGMAVSYRVDGTVAGGVPVAVALEISGVVADGAQVRFGTDEGLRVTAGGELRSLPPGSSQISLTVVPPATGTGYLHVFTTQNGATSATSIAFSAGADAAAKPAVDSLKNAPSGENIISMPVK